MPTTAKAWAAAYRTMSPSMVPPTVNPPRIRGSVAWGSVNQRYSGLPSMAGLCVVRAVSATRMTANATPRPTRIGKARAKVVSSRWALTTRKLMARTIATYSGLGTICTHAAAATAHTSHVTAWSGLVVRTCGPWICRGWCRAVR